MDERLEAMYRRFTWRILPNYVTPWGTLVMPGYLRIPDRASHPPIVLLLSL